MTQDRIEKRVRAAREDCEARGETFYPGASRIHLAAFPPKERWDDWVELDSKAWPKRVEKRSMLVPTICFNCESACGLLAYVDKDTMQVRKFEGNPEHPASRGRNCAKGPATINQVEDPDRILYPLERVGPRGAGQWKQISWDDALDRIAARITKALDEGRHNEIMYHVGRPGEDGYTERVLAAWGIDGHNSHTNICSSGARVGYSAWMGYDRPSPDHGNADVILLISAHLESGHYFNPHAQRIMEAKKRGAKLIVFDVRLSNTATHADYYMPSYPGSEAAVMLSIARHMLETGQYDREFVRRWWNWEQYMAEEQADKEASFENFEQCLRELYASYTFAYASAESGIPEERIREVAEVVAGCGTRLSTHNWRSASSANLGGWQVARCLFLLNALKGAVATEGGVYPNAWNKFVAKPIYSPPHPSHWNELSWPQEYPVAFHEMSILLPHLVAQGRGKLDTYFTRVYNPLWTNPDGFSWIEMLKDEDKLGLHVALTPTWNESAFFADMILPMGIGSERHDVCSYETHDAQWFGFRQPVLRAAAERAGKTITDSRETNPGEVWEENEFWIELSWRMDPDGSRGIRQYFESRAKPGEKLGIDEYYGWMFEHSVPGLAEAAAAEDRTPLGYMRQYGAFEVAKKIGQIFAEVVPASELDDQHVTGGGRVYTRAPKPATANCVPHPAPDADAEGRRPVGVEVDGQILRGWPTPSGKLEFYSKTHADWGWREYAIPTYIKSHVHPDHLREGQLPLIPTFRLPVQIHTRSANAKWLDEIAHMNPLWIHPSHAAKLGIETGDLAKVETDIGYFVVKAWVTEGIRPGVVACSHHMGRWKPEGETGAQRQLMATVKLDQQDTRWGMKRLSGAVPYESSDKDTSRIWWNDVGVHQNLTFPVHPDPISGMHCWHQAVRVTKAGPGDHNGDISVDTNKSRAVFEEWLAKTRPARENSPDGTRRPHWYMRPLRPTRDAYQLPDQG